ncbi:MAG: hypothetical protein PSX81_08140 [bacterium]|nr:hypothetical protein [bacterium]
MKSLFRCLLTVLFLTIFGLQAQQNFINVPSSEVTKQGKFFLQQQINFNGIIQANSTIDYGFGKGFEAGFNILGLNYNEKAKSFFNNDTNFKDPYNPLIAFNALKQFKLSDNSNICIGGQLGANFRNGVKTREAGIAYLNFSRKDLFGENSQLVFGLYYNSRHYGGQGNRLGIWSGLQVPITKKIYGVVESIIGSNAISYTTIAGMYFAKKSLPLTLGLQIPNASRNAYSIVFEITYIPQ